MIVKDIYKKDLRIPQGIGNKPVAVEKPVVNDPYLLVLFNNATKNIWAMQLHETTGSTELSYDLAYAEHYFEPLEPGEYSYALIYFDTKGQQWAFSGADTLLDSKVSVGTGGETYRIGDLNPEVGLLRYDDGTEREEPEYRDTNKSFYYRKKQ